MQLCAGAIRSKNSLNVLMKNILDSCTGAIGFYLFGYAFAYGHKPNRTSNEFIGDWWVGCPGVVDAGQLIRMDRMEDMHRIPQACTALTIADVLVTAYTLWAHILYCMQLASCTYILPMTVSLQLEPPIYLCPSPNPRFLWVPIYKSVLESIT